MAKNIYTVLVIVVLILPFTFNYGCWAKDVIGENEVRNGGNHGDPVYILNIYITKTDASVKRMEEFTLNYSFENKERDPGKNITNISYEEFLTNNFELVNPNENENSKKITIELDSLKPQEKNNFTKIIRASKSSDLNSTCIIDSDRRNTQYDQKSYNYPIISNPNPEIHVLNNDPVITYAEVVLTSPCIHSRDNLFCKDSNSPVSITLKVSAQDKDYDNLSYIWRVKNKSIHNVEMWNPPEILRETYNNNESYAWDNVTPGYIYSFSVMAIDNIGNYSEIPVNVTTVGSGYYPRFTVPTFEIYRIPAIILSMILTIVLLIFLFAEYKLKNLYNYIHIAPVILAITCIYGCLLYMESRDISLLGRVYFTSLAFFELYIYLIVFIIIVYFTEACFYKERGPTNGFQKKMGFWLVNSIFMALLLLSLYLIISQMGPAKIESYLSAYYSTIGGIFASILGITVALYAAYNPNPTERYLQMPVKRTKKSNTGMSKRSRALRYLMVLYGFIVAFSLWGLSLGASINFVPLVNIGLSDLPNLLSIFIFEVTLLLIPPALSSLYHLIEISER